MSDSSSGKEEEKESLSDEWTFVDNDESVENEDYNQENEDEENEGGVGPPPAEEEEEEEVEVTEEEEEEAAPTKGQSIEAVKVGSGTESSDIETLEYPGCEELRDLGNFSLPFNRGFLLTTSGHYSDFAGDADTESVSSEGSPEEKVRKRRTRKPEAIQDEETDLSLASSPSLPEDLPSIRPDSQYVHKPDPELNYRLNLVTTFVVILVTGLALGHFLGIINLSEDVEPGWSRRSLWDENLNSAQIMENLKFENEELQERVLELQAEHTEPFKIKGKEGKEAREMREKINHLISENEDMRLALSRHQFSELPDADKAEFNKVSQENHHLRTTVLQLKHLVPDNNKLEQSLQYLKEHHLDLLREVGKIRHEQPLPKELTPMVKQLEEMRTVVAEEARKRNPSSTINNARSYLMLMGQMFSQFSYLHEWDDKSAGEKIDLAKDIFHYWVPKGIKITPKMQDEIGRGRSQFNTLKNSLRKKWRQLKELTNPDTIVNVGQSTVAKMNRVIVNVVNKVKEIGQTTIMSTNKQLEHSLLALSTGFAKLNKQFDETWKSLEIRISMSEKYDMDDDDDDNDENDDNDDNDDDNDNDDDDDDDVEEDVIDTYIKSSNADKDAGDKGEEKPEARDKAPTTDKRDGEVKSTQESKKIRDEIQKQILNREIDKIQGKVEIKKKSHQNKRREVRKEIKVDSKQKEKRKRPERVNKKETPQTKGKEAHKEEKHDKIFHEDKKEEKKSIADKIKEKKEADKQEVKEDSKYFKGQYNRFDKGKEEAKASSPEPTRKRYRRDDDDDDDDDESGHKTSGLKRHWEKPQRKSYFRENSGPKKQFIRRRGKDSDEGKKWKNREWDKKDDRNYRKDKIENYKNKDKIENYKKKDKIENVYKKKDKIKNAYKKKINIEKIFKKNDKWNGNVKFLKSSRNENFKKVGFDFKKGRYHNIEKQLTSKGKAKFLKASRDILKKKKKTFKGQDNQDIY